MKTRANNFDGLRLMGALLVIYQHQFAVAGMAEPPGLFHHKLGNIGVLLFFSISGYLITGSWLNDPSPRRFLNKRALRIWPAYIAVVFLAPFLGIMFAHPQHVPAMLAVYWQKIIFQGYERGFFLGNPHAACNPVLWSIPFELGCYAVLGACGIVFRKYLQWFLLGGAALLLAGFVIWYDAENTFQHSPIPVTQLFTLAYYGSFFLAGALLKCFPQALSKMGILAILAIGVAGFVSGQIMVGMLFTVPVLMISVGLRSWPVLRSAGKLGDLSYGLYLWGWPSQQIVLVLLGKNQPYGVLLAASVALATGFALLSWHFIEKPCLSRKPTAKKAAVIQNKTSLTQPAIALGC